MMRYVKLYKWILCNINISISNMNIINNVHSQLDRELSLHGLNMKNINIILNKLIKERHI